MGRLEKLARILEAPAQGQCDSISLPGLKEQEEEVVSLCSCLEESGRAVVSGVSGPKDVP